MALWLSRGSGWHWLLARRETGRTPGWARRGMNVVAVFSILYMIIVRINAIVTTIFFDYGSIVLLLQF